MDGCNECKLAAEFIIIAAFNSTPPPGWVLNKSDRSKSNPSSFPEREKEGIIAPRCNRRLWVFVCLVSLSPSLSLAANQFGGSLSGGKRASLWKDELIDPLPLQQNTEWREPRCAYNQVSQQEGQKREARPKEGQICGNRGQKRGNGGREWGEIPFLLNIWAFFCSFAWK